MIWETEKKRRNLDLADELQNKDLEKKRIFWKIPDELQNRIWRKTEKKRRKNGEIPNGEKYELQNKDLEKNGEKTDKLEKTGMSSTTRISRKTEKKRRKNGLT